MGVQADAAIVVTFSEPMRKADAQAAYQSSSPGITAGSVTFSWDSAGEVLTIVPTAPLAYAQGEATEDEEDLVDPIEYVFSVTTAATDLAGNALEDATDSNFFTLREITQQLTKLGGDADQHPLTGTANSDGSTDEQNVSARVGTSDLIGDNKGSRGFFTMDLSPLPTSLVEVVGANLYIAQLGISDPSPLAAFGDLTIHHVVGVEALDQDAYDAVGEDNELGVFTTESDNGGIREYSVTDEVAEDVAERTARNDRSQFALSFELAPLDEDPRSVRYRVTGTNAPRLEVLYLRP